MDRANGNNSAGGHAWRWVLLAAAAGGAFLAIGWYSARPGAREPVQLGPRPAWAVEAAERQRRAAAELGLPVADTLEPSGVAMRLALIPAGTFQMGSPRSERCRSEDESPRRQVTVSRAFYMGVCEVTQAQYEAVTGANPSDLVGSARPVERVSWAEARRFCEALSTRTGRTVRLPTEAEWEYACRAGSAGVFGFGKSSRHLHKHANYCELANTDLVPWRNEYHNDGHDRTAPVGSYPANAWGLHDMHGNVWEWCGDWYDERGYEGAARADPTGPPAGAERVVRGGSWLNNAANCRSANRGGKPPDQRSYAVGFRVVVEVAGPKGRKGTAGDVSRRMTSAQPEGRLVVATGASPWWEAAEQQSPRRGRLTLRRRPYASIAPLRGSCEKHALSPRARARGYQQSPRGLQRHTNPALAERQDSRVSNYLLPPRSGLRLTCVGGRLWEADGRELRADSS